MSPDDRSVIGRYIEALAGRGAPHAAVAAAINRTVPGARVAGTLVGRWRSGSVAVSPGNLAALARAYGRSPLEAFVIAGYLEESDAREGLDADALALIRHIRGDGDGGGSNVVPIRPPSVPPSTVTEEDLIDEPSVAELERQDHEGDEDPEDT